MMTIKTPFNFTTPDQVKIYCYKWEKTSTTNKPVKGLIQIAHGMAEHIRRYDSFSQHLTDHGFIVFGNDHRGHGQTASNKNDQGFFARKDGFEKVVDDMKQLTAIMKEEYPHTPVFLLGHSMGSFLTRRYIQKYGGSLQGVVLSGTGSDKGIISKIGILLAKLEVKRIGAQTPSPFLDKLTFGQYNKKYQVQRTKFDFLSRDERLVDEYITDDHCGFICSAQFFNDLISGLHLIQKHKELIKTPKDLPILFVAGDQDPVGDYGRGVKKVFHLYNNHCENVSLKLYEHGRHEMLNELNNEEVYEDITQWLYSQLKKKSS